MYPKGLDGRKFAESPKNKRAGALAKGETHKGEQEAVPYGAAAAVRLSVALTNANEQNSDLLRAFIRIYLTVSPF